MNKAKKLFTRQSLLCIFLMALMAVMSVFTLYNITFEKRTNIKKMYHQYITQSYSKIVCLSKTCIDVLESIDDYVPARTSFISVYGLTQRAVNNRYVPDTADAYSDVMRLDNGQLCYVGTPSDTIDEVAAKNMTKLKGILDKKGIGLLYVMAPYKTDPDNPGLQTGVADWQNDKIRNVQKALTDAGIDNLNLLDNIKAQNLDFSKLFFNTDHHWTPATALWAAQTVSKYLNDKYNYNIDLSLLDKSQFNSTVYENIFLGSQGKKVGPLYGGVDDFELLTPKYDTDFNFLFLRLNKKEQTRSGSFEDALLFKQNLVKDYFNVSVYATYSGGDYLKTCFTNNNMNSGKKILLVRDSFSGTFAPFFALAACDKLYTVDTRRYKDSLVDYIDEVEPDIVIYLEHPYFNLVRQPIK